MTFCAGASSAAGAVSTASSWVVDIGGGAGAGSGALGFGAVGTEIPASDSRIREIGGKNSRFLFDLAVSRLFLRLFLVDQRNACRGWSARRLWFFRRNRMRRCLSRRVRRFMRRLYFLFRTLGRFVWNRLAGCRFFCRWFRFCCHFKKSFMAQPC